MVIKETANYDIQITHRAQPAVTPYMFNKLKIGENDLCACGLAQQNTEHVLQSCTLLSDLRTEILPTNGTLAQKLYGTKQELTCTTDFIEASGLMV